MKLFDLKFRPIAPLFVLCCFVFFGSQSALAQSSLWLGNDTVGDVFQTTTSGAVLTDLASLPTSGIAWDGNNLYFANPAGNFTKRTADGKTILDSFSIAAPSYGEDLAWDSKRNVLWRIGHNPAALQKIDPVGKTLIASYSIPNADGTLGTLGGLGIAYDPIRDELDVSFCSAGCTSLAAGLVERIDPNTGNVLGELFRTSGFATGGLAYDTSNDTLWVGDAGVVRNMTRSGATLSSFPRPSTPPSGFVDGLEFVPTSETGEAIFISTFGGNEIVKVVDGAPSAATTVINTDATATPEDIVVGPDGKIYICDADQNRIRRMNQDGTGLETVYSTNPAGPEGPSFNTLGDLYFNTRNAPHTGVWKIDHTQLNPIPPGGATPVNVVSNAAPPAGDGSTFGEGTTFDAQDNLLFVDRSGGKVWRFNASTSTLTAIITGLSTPLGIAVDSAGDIFVSNYGTHQLLRYLSDGTPQGPYVTFAAVDCSAACDSPAYLQFDASDKLYLVTNQNSSAQFGKVWRVDPVGTPPSTGTPTLLVDLNARGFASSGAALGLGLPATTFTTDRKAVAAGMTTNFTNGNIISQAVQVPPDAMVNDVATMQMSFIQFAPGVFNSTRLTGTPGNTFSGGNQGPFSSADTACTPIAGTGGNCMVMEGKCFNSSGMALLTCNMQAVTTLIQLTSHYKTQSPQPIPCFLIADDGANNWANIVDGYDPNDPTISGGTRGTQMDTVICNRLGTPVADTTPPTVTATTFPLPNGAGWNNTSPVSVIINATDDQLINNITYSTMGAQTIGSTKVLAASTFFPIANQGSTTVSFSATDNASPPFTTNGAPLTVKIDTTPPTITITTPPSGAAYALNQVVASSFACADPNPSGANLVSGVAFCTGPANVNTTSGGGTFTVNASDVAGNTATKSVNYTVVPYNAFVQQPINPDGSSVFNAKRGVIPVKFTLTMNNGATCALPAATIALTRTSDATPTLIDEGIYLMAADNGPNFRISGCQYIYNLASSSLGPGAYRVDIIISGAVVGSGFFALK